MPAQKSDKTYSISELSNMLQVSEHVVRRWEKTYNLQTKRNEKGHRVYTTFDLQNFLKIQNILNSEKTVEKKIAHKKADNAIKGYAKTNKKIALATTFSMALLFLFALQFNTDVKEKLQPFVLSVAKEKVAENIDTQRVLGARDRLASFVFNVNVPTNLGSTLSVEGDTTILGGLFVPTINEVTAIDLITKTTLEETLELGGDFAGTLNNVTLAPGSVEGPSLAEELTYDGTLNIEGVLQAAGEEGSDGQLLSSTGDGVEWIDPDDDADTLDGIDSAAFLRSNTSDTFSSGTLDFSDGTFLDLSAITHNDTAAQGLKLPQATSFTAPASGEGFIAYDTDNNGVYYYNGTAWTSMSSSLQGAYDTGSTIQMSAASGDIRIYNDSADQILFIDEDTARVGIGSTSPAYKLDVTGSVNIATGSDLYVEGEALRTTQLGNRLYVEENFVTDSQTFTASIEALDQQVQDLTLGTAGLWTDAGSFIYLVDTTDDFVLGGTTLANSMFSIDESAGIFLFGGDNTVDPVLRFEATDGSVGSFGFNLNDAFHISNANLGIGTTAPSYALDVNGDFNTNTLYIGGVQVSSTPAEINILDGALISTTELNLLNGRTGTLVDSNNVSSYATTAVDSGAGLTGGGTVGSLTVDVGAGSGISVAADAVALGALTATWNQTGGFDIFLNNASSELQILESVGGTYKGIFDVGDLAADRTYTFPDTEGTVLIDASAPFELSGWDQDVSDDHTGTGSSGQVTYWTGTYAQAGSDNLFWSNANASLGIGTTDPSAYLDLRAATTSRPSLSIASGSQPSAPSAGDIYADGLNIYWYNGSTWDDLTSGGGGLFTDGGATTYLTSLTDNLAIGGTGPSSAVFAIEESTGNFYFSSDNVSNPTLNFEATDSDAGILGFNTNDMFYISGANLGIGTTNASSTLHITPTGAAAFQIDPYGGAAGNTGEVRFLELAANGTDYTGFKAPDSLASSVIYELPNAAGSADYVLTWQTGNTLQWKAVTGVGGAGDITSVGSITSGAAFSDSTADNDWLGLGSAAGRIEFDDQATDEINVLDANFGIGTTAPSSTLSVGASSQFRVSSTGDLTRINNVAYAWPSSQAAADNYVLTNDSAGNLTWESVVSLGGVDGTGTANYVPLWSDSDTLTTSSLYETGGNVGVGTTAPSYKLDLGGAGGNIINVSPTGTAGYVYFGGANSNSIRYASLEFGLYTNQSQGMNFYTAGSPRMRITSGGLVGIGTTNPATALDVLGAGTFSSYVTADTVRIGAGSDAFLDIKAATTADAQINLTSSSGTDVSVPVSGDFWWNGTNLYFYNGSTNTDLLAGGGTFDGTGVTNYIAKFTDADTLSASVIYELGGNLGIGTTAPASKLQVAGTFTADTSISTPLISLSGTGTLNGLDAVDSTTENTIEALIFDTDAENITGVWEIQDNVAFNLGNEADFTIMYDETTNDQFQISDGTNSFFTLSDQGTTAIARINGDDIYVESTGNVGIGTTDPTEALHVNGDIRIQGGELYFDPLSSSSSTTEGTVYYDSDVDHLFLYGGDSAFHRIALDMTKYTGTDTTVPNQSYVQIAHNQGTNDISVVGWFYDTVTSLWKKITQNDTTSTYDLDNEFNPSYEHKIKITDVTMDKEEHSFGDGTDGAITVSTNTSINTSDLISGRSCPDGGDAVNYNISSFTDQDTAVLSTTPSSGCLAVGDEVLIINLQGTTTAYGNVGNWETLRIESIATNTVNFTTEKTKYYGDGTDSNDTNLGTAAGTQRVMLQRVPNYTTVTVNASVNFYPDDYNGAKGGVMFFRATGAVASNGNIHADSKGYRGGTNGGNGLGGGGGEAFCGERNGTAGGDGGDYSARNGGNGNCGGGGGAGQDDASSGTAGSGSATLGGAGGGGGAAEDSGGLDHGRGGGGGGAGYGTAGTHGTLYETGGAAGDGGTNTSGGGGVGSHPGTESYAGAGGGGGTYGDANLVDLYMGSGGAAGGDGEINDGPTWYDGGDGGDGGGIVYIAADSITVSGTVSNDGGAGGTGGGNRAGAGGGGAGGSVKLIGNDLTLGSSLVAASGGAGGNGSYADGGTGGSGRIAAAYADSISGTTSPAYTSLTLDYNPYAVYVSDAIETPATTAFNDISWTETLATDGEIQFQTRSGATADSTDGTWEAWKPTTGETMLESANTHTNWTGTNATVAEGDVARNVKYYEDDDVDNSENLAKVTATADNGFAEATISATDISTKDYITFWVRSSVVGEVVKFGFGEAAATEQEEEIYINHADSWQKVYWDISDVAAASRNAVTKLRLTVLTNGGVVQFDNVQAASYLTTVGGSTITSTANEYVQYRAILSTTNNLVSPSFSDVVINLTNPDGTLDIDANVVKDPGDIDDETSAERIDPETLEYHIYDKGDGADGAITVSSNTSINTVNLISGRSCSDGGDAVNYSVTALTSTTATLSSTPSTGCLAVGDEILLINLQGTNSNYGNVGNHETLRIQSIATNVVTFTTSKDNYYGDGTDSDDTNLGTAEGTQRVMLQRVPNYTTVTVNSSINFYPNDYNGSKNGVMFFRATGAVSVNGNIHADSKGYRGGTNGANGQGGGGGEAFCGDRNGAGAAGGDGGDYNSRNGANGICGGGGGAGQDDASSGTAGSGSATLGGAGGGGGAAEDSGGLDHGRGGGGGGAGYGTIGYHGTAYETGGAAGDGGTSTSGGGGVGSHPGTESYAGAGGGGGTYGDSELVDLMLGASGGAGGDGEINDGPTWYDGGNGGDGGGIVYIAADSITVSGTVSNDGGTGGTGGGNRAGAGGGGAGGSIKLMADTLTLGATKVVAGAGAGGNGSYADGGAGGKGRIAIYYATSVSGTTDPTYTIDTNADEYDEYKVYVSKEIGTPGATSFTDIEWTEDLDTNGEIQFQTRSGNTTDSTDGTWEAWKPTTSSTTLETADTHTNWTGTNMTVADGDVTRNVDYYEDEDEGTSGNLTKLTTTAAGGFAEATISSTDITSYDYITFWVRNDTGGDVLTFGLGEAAATEETESVYISQADTWQKVYWDITDFDSSSCTGGNNCNAVTKLRFTVSPNSSVTYIDNIKAESYLTTNAGSSITSTANNYIQYRAILSTTSVFNSPSLSEVRINYSDGSSQTIDDRVANQNFVDELDLDIRLRKTEVELDDYKSIRTIKTQDTITLDGDFDPGTGADGSITVSSNGSINTTDYISGRSCADGGDAVNYSVNTLTSNTATLTVAPSSGCLAVGDEVLLINLRGTPSAYINVGHWETLRISDIQGETITFKTAKSKYYGDNIDDDSNIGTDTAEQQVMLQRVPNYKNVTVNTGINFYPDDYDGNVGGVMFFRASGAVSVNGNLHVDGKGYRGGTNGGNGLGGGGGEAFCGTRNGTAGGDGGDYNNRNGVNGNCGGGGGAGQDDGSSGSAGSGSDKLGGAGGGGGAAEDSGGLDHGRGGGGGGAGYGTAGTHGTAYETGGAAGDGGTSTSGGGGVGSHPGTESYAGAGGGGGTYGDANLNDLYMGSGGAAGGDGEINDGPTWYDGGDGGDGGGIVYIAADSINVNGTMSSDGNSGAAPTDRAGGGGGGAGGSIKLIGNTVQMGEIVNVGSEGVSALGGSGGNGTYADGGSGGKGRIAVYYTDTGGGTSNPVAYEASVPTYNYSVFISDEFSTQDVTDLGRISWRFDDNSYGNVEVQTRTGATPNSTDNTWEEWRPVVATTNTLSLNNANTHGDWVASSSNITIADGDTTRDVDFFEDEDESTSGNLTKLTVGANSNSYVETVFGETDISSYSYITLWLNSSIAGNVVKVGFGETAATEHEQTFHLDRASEWQKVYWDISAIPDHERDAIKRIRITALSNSYTLYFDNIAADLYHYTPEGSNIASTPDEYIQYRAILTTSNSGYKPYLYNVELTWENGYKIEQTDTNTVRLYNYSGDTQNLRLEAIVFGADLAEWYTVEDKSIGPGDLVALSGRVDDYGVPLLEKTDELNDKDIIGAISTKAGKELGLESEDRRLLALAGRIPVKVDPASAEINPGDSITSGPSKGLAKRAELGERAIGRALESWKPDSGKDKVLILVAPVYTNGTEVIASKVGDLEEKVSTISTLLGLEGTGGSSDAVLSGLTEAASDMAETFSSFQTYVDGLGLNVTENALGDALLAVNSDFTVTGATSLGDTTITGDFNVGQMKFDPSTNSIDVLGAACINDDTNIHTGSLCESQTLYLQKNKSGNIDLFDGAILIEPNGNITLKGVVDAEVIIADEYVVKSAAQTTGSSILPAGQTETTVETSAVENNSKVFVTPTSKTEGQSLYIKGKIDGVSFTVAIDESVFEDINFDWWVLNVQE